jgi:hypothetical protein
LELVHRALPLAAVAIALCAAGAAPAASPPAKQRFVASANAICGRSAARLKRLTRVPDLATRASRGFAELDRMIATIARLTPPRGDERTVTEILRRFRSFTAALRSFARTEQRGGDESAAVAQLVRVKTKARRAALGYGLRICAGLFE